MADLNGKGKWIASGAGVIALALLTWNFSAVHALQLAAAAREERLTTLRADLEYQRAALLAFQLRVDSDIVTAQNAGRAALQRTQDEMRESLSHISDILTDVRIKLGVTAPPGRGK